jgi:putative aminopeptidase FrvX
MKDRGMFMELSINKKYIIDTAKEILEFDSPTGFCFEIMNKIKNIAEGFGYDFETTSKGCGIITIKGNAEERVIGLSAHVDTLGAMVRSITCEGKLKFTLLGGPIVPTLDGEYCRVRTREGKIYTGTFLSTSPAAHVFEDSSSKVRDPKNMEVRIDENVKVLLKIRSNFYIYT